MKNKITTEQDLQNKKDTQEESATIDLPDVEDIPGQENIRPPQLKEFEDTTASSSGEEGDEIWKQKDELLTDATTEVSETEKELLRKAASYESDEDEEDLKNAIPDTTDEDGEELNEQFSYRDLSAKDLDIPDEFEDDE